MELVEDFTQLTPAFRCFPQAAAGTVIPCLPPQLLHECCDLLFFNSVLVHKEASYRFSHSPWLCTTAAVAALWGSQLVTSHQS